MGSSKDDISETINGSTLLRHAQAARKSLLALVARQYQGSPLGNMIRDDILAQFGPACINCFALKKDLRLCSGCRLASSVCVCACVHACALSSVTSRCLGAQFSFWLRSRKLMLS